MSVLNPLSREVSAKIVYYGPGLSGKTTSLKHIYKSVKPERRGELVSLATETDRTIFFDFLPLHVEHVRGMTVRFQLYTVPGQVFYAATRKLVLNGADGVVFVVDSQKICRDANLESLQGLKDNLDDLGVDPERFPIVFQYNKRDLPDDQILPMEELSKLLNARGGPEFPSSATQGSGVLQTLKEASRLVIRSLWKQQPTVRPATSAPVAPERSTTDDSIVGRVMAVAGEYSSDSGLSEPAETHEPPPRQGEGISFASLWEGDANTVDRIERRIIHGQYPGAVRGATAALAELFESLPGPSGGDGHAAKAALLGLDGREYLRLCRLATAPEESLTQLDALFALHILVSARFKARML